MAELSRNSIGVGLIGVGRHGRRYLDHLISDVSGARVAAICRKRIDEPTDRQLSGIPVYGNYRDLIADPSVQAVVAVTSPSLCHDICLASVKAGKPILIEKPLAMTGSEGRAMVAAADKAEILLMTAQTMRFDSTILRVKQQLPTIGHLQRGVLTSHIELRSGLPSATGNGLGAVLEIGVHLLDLVRFLTDDEVMEVSCDIEGSSIGAETNARASVRTAGGLRCSLDIARSLSMRIGTMEWIGTEGTITADWIQRKVVRDIGGNGPTVETIEPYPTIVRVLRAFLVAINTHTDPPVTGEDGCRAVELVDACYASAKRGGATVSLAGQN